MKKIVIVYLLVLLSNFALSQENNDQDLISTIETLSNYSKVIENTEIQYITSINLNRNTNLLRITETQDYSIKYVERTISFYINDVNKNNMICIIEKKKSNREYLINVELSTLNNGVEYSEIVYEKGKEAIDVSDLNSRDKIVLNASGNSMSKKSAKKYVNSIMELLDIDHVIEEKSSSD